MKYVELLCKSNFSFLTGASHPEELVEAAVQEGLSGLALSDQNGMYGVAKAFRRAKTEPNFKFIVGSELTFSDHTPLVLLCQTRVAYGHLCKLLTLSHQDKPKGEARLQWQEFLKYSQQLGEGGWVALPKEPEKAKLLDLQKLFPHSLYLPLTRYLDGHDAPRTQAIGKISRDLKLPIVATNDVYYHVKARKVVQDVLISVREGKPLQEVGYRLFPNAERYIRSPEMMGKLFSDLPEALENTVKIADSCSFSLKELRYRYPSEWIPSGHTAQSYLEHLVKENAPKVCKGKPSEAIQKQIIHELKLISQLEYADYFLTIYDIVHFARGKDILCQGRGSAANSAVCYALGITAIDPIQMNLLFERFISAERGEPPDIDVDFEHERREEVIQYIYQKYGRHRAAMVSAVITYRRRSAFREVAKAFGVPVGTLSAKKVERNFSELCKDFSDPAALKEKIETIAKEIAGFPRHLSIHSGGFTLSADPITEIVPVEPARMDGRTIIQWDKYDLDELGLLKVDVLSLGMLSALRKTLEYVGMKLHEIPHDDPSTYAMIQKCDTVGAFQIESRAQMSMLGRLLPKNFYDLVIEVAIVRPGPIVGQMVHPYLKRRRGLEKLSFPNEKVAAILRKTLGIPLFQEQIMKLAIDLANFSPGDADMLRRSINAWRTSAPIEKMATRLMEGLQKSGLPASFAKQIFDQIQGFSEYGFPESHAASFALLAYASCYLKCHHPAEFTCALINSQPLGFYRNDTLLYDAIRHGVKVLPVSIHESQWDCFAEEKSIRLGFRVVKGLAKTEYEWLAQERKQKEFSSLADFLKRSTLRKDVLYRLAMAGRFHDFSFTARDALWSILEYETIVDSRRGEQLSLFFSSHFQLPKENGKFQTLSGLEKIEEDYTAFALSTHGHPMEELRKLHKQIPKTNSLNLKALRSGSIVSVSGLLLIRQRPPTAKGVVFSTLEDEFGFTDIILHPEVYEKYKEVFLNNCFLTVRGRLQQDMNTVNLLVQEVHSIFPATGGGDIELGLDPTQYFYA